MQIFVTDAPIKLPLEGGLAQYRGYPLQDVEALTWHISSRGSWLGEAEREKAKDSLGELLAFDFPGLEAYIYLGDLNKEKGNISPTGRGFHTFIVIPRLLGLEDNSPTGIIRRSYGVIFQHTGATLKPDSVSWEDVFKAIRGALLEVNKALRQASK